MAKVTKSLRRKKPASSRTGSASSTGKASKIPFTTAMVPIRTSISMTPSKARNSGPKTVTGVPIRTPVLTTDAETIAEARALAQRGTKELGNLIFLEDSFKVTDEVLNEAVDQIAGGDSDPQWEELEAQMLEASCAFFAQELLTGPPEPPYRGRFLIAEHHEEWDDLIAAHDRICVLAPRDHGKTFFFDFAYPIWKATTQKGSIGFIFSATQDQAVRILSDIKSELESNPKLQYLVPSRRDGGAWSSTHIRLSNGSHVYARGFGTKVRGAHPHWIVVDDGLNDETIYSEVVRKKQQEYFYTAITNMCVPGGQIIVVGTPFHADDLYADLERNLEYEFRKYQAIQQDGRVLWSERYSREILEARREEIGSIRFTREFQCEPVADDMSLFPGYLFKGSPIECYNLTLGMPKAFWEEAGVQIFMGCDFAMSSSVQADYTVVWVMGVDKSGNRWLVEMIRKKGLGFQEQLSLINEQGRKYEPALIFLEANQMQRIFGDELIRTSDLPIKQFVTGVQKNSLDRGVPSLRVLLENRKFRVPRGDERSVEMTNIWMDEMRAFTWSDGKLQSVGRHDDTVMACWICDQAIRHGGFKFTFGEEYDGQSESIDDLIAELTGETPEPKKRTVGRKTTGERIEEEVQARKEAGGGNGNERTKLGTMTQEELLQELVWRQLGARKSGTSSGSKKSGTVNLVDSEMEW